MSSNNRLVESSLELSWSLWTELGVPGVIRRHSDFAMDVEPLLIFTSRIADAEPRLRDESLAWVARNHRFVSRARLRGLLRFEPQEAQADFGPYAASISQIAPGVWPGSTEPVTPPIQFRSRRRGSFEEPSLLRLRLRALLGVGTRSELAHAFVAQPETARSAQDLVRLSGFTKANVNQELEAFVLAGLLSRVGTGNRWDYRLVEPARLLNFAGRRPRFFVDWAALLRVVGALLVLHRQRGETDDVVRTVDIAAFLTRRGEDLDRVGFPRRPPDVGQAELAEWFDSAAAEFVGALATAETPVGLS